MTLNDKFECISGIYIVQNLINGKYYIGETYNIHKRILQHKRPNSGLLYKAIQKYGVSNFSVYVEYFQFFDKNDLLNLEEQLILRFNCLAPNGYNISKRGSSSEIWKGRKHTPETKRKMSISSMGNKSRTGMITSSKTKTKLSIANKGKSSPMKGKIHTTESKIKMSKSQKGKLHSDEHRKNNSKSHKGIKHSNETRHKMSNSHKGNIQSEDTKRKISNSLKGRKLSDETKRKLSETRKEYFRKKKEINSSIQEESYSL